MSPQTRMPRYDIRNDGAGPYLALYCDKCSREFRSKPDIGRTVAQDIIGKSAGGLLRGIPIVGGAVADKVSDDRRYTREMTQQQIDAHWAQVADRFHECPTCQMICCPSCWDAQTGYCEEDSPRRGEIAEAEAEQAAGVIKGIASAFGLGAVVKGAVDAAKTAQTQLARCSKCGTPAPRGTKFCPECGGAMMQPASTACPKCGAEAMGAKFCPECGTKMPEAAPPPPTKCPKCGADAKGAKFCMSCGTKIG